MEAALRRQAGGDVFEVVIPFGRRVYSQVALLWSDALCRRRAAQFVCTCRGNPRS